VLLHFGGLDSHPCRPPARDLRHHRNGHPRVSTNSGSRGSIRRPEQFENVPGHGAVATVEGRRVAVGNLRLMERDRVELAGLGARRWELAAGGRTVVVAAVNGRAVGLVAIADAPRPTAKAAVQALHEQGVEVVMLTGDNRATRGVRKFIHAARWYSCRSPPSRSYRCTRPSRA
jgi:haloacid dehalogenase-like hydrolase